MEVIDETLLNDDDEDLDYDLDPKEENALLQEETDLLDGESGDEDVLDINVDYEQMDVNDCDKTDLIKSDKSRSEIKFRKNDNGGSGNRICIQNHKRYKSDEWKSHSRVLKRSSEGAITNRCVKRSKTVLINPRFKGHVCVNGKPLAWEKPPPILNELQTNQQYIQPWSSGNVPNHNMHPPQIPVNNYNAAPFVSNNSYPYVQQSQHQVLQPQQHIFQQQQQHVMQQQQPIFQSQPFAQNQVFMNPLPLMNTPLLNHNVAPQPMPIQTEHCDNNYLAPPLHVQQIPEAPKLPVHQRLGISMNNFDQSPSVQNRFNNNQFNQMPFENNEFNQFSPQKNFNQNHIYNMNQTRRNNNQYSNNKHDNYHRKQPRKLTGNPKAKNNRILLSPRNEKIEVNSNAQLSGNVQCLKMEESISSNIVVVPEDEDDETRQYRIKIEEQKRKREEVLRKKEENRLKNVLNTNIESAPSTVVQKVISPVRNFKPQKVKYQHRSQQNHQFVKPQVNTNNIVIMGNDDQCYFNSRQKKSMGINNKSVKTPSLRIVTAEPISSSNVNSKIEQFENEVDPNSLSSFLSNRVVLTQDNLLQTNIVVVKNLATATTQPKILKLCQGIGKVQKLQMDTNERQATIHFDSVASAHKFYTKYRRYMIDLSMIQVDLILCEGSS